MTKKMEKCSKNNGLKAYTRAICLAAMVLYASIFLVSAWSETTIYLNQTETCYQENANSSTVTDTSCGLNYSGYYSGLDNFFSGGMNVIDKDWSTSDFFSVWEGRFNVTYFAPSRNLSEAVWAYKDFYGYHNYTLSTYSCNITKVELSVRYTTVAGIGGLYLYCRTNAGTFTAFAGVSGAGTIYEEAMYWQTTPLAAVNSLDLNFIARQNYTGRIKIPPNITPTNAFFSFNYLTTAFAGIQNMSIFIGDTNIYKQPVNINSSVTNQTLFDLIRNNTVFFYNFDENITNIIANVTISQTNRGNTSIGYNAPIGNSQRLGSYGNFGFSNNSLNCSNGCYINTTYVMSPSEFENFTIAFWVKGVPQGTTNDPMFIFSNVFYESGGGTGMAVVARQTNISIDTYIAGGAYRVYANCSPNTLDDTWHQFAVTKNVSGAWICYQDGVEISRNNSFAVATTTNNIKNWTIFASPNPSVRRYFNGSLDDVTFINRTMSASEITGLYNLGEGLRYPFTDLAPSFTTYNLQNVTNTYLSTCTLSAGYCFVPYTFNFMSLTDFNLTASFDSTGLVETNQTFNSTVLETSQQVFQLNYTYDPTIYQLSQAMFIYNGTSYSSTVTNPAYGKYTATSIIQIPLVGAETNRSFYWNVSLTNSSGTFYFNSSLKNHTVYNISLGSCLADRTTFTVNITSYDQDSQSTMNGVRYDSTLNYFAGDGSIYRSVAINGSEYCMNRNNTIKLTGLLQAFFTAYQDNTYYFAFTPVNNITTNLSLGMLTVATSTPFILQLVDQNNLAVPNYYVYVNRCNISNMSNCPTVQGIQTDSNGKSVVFIEPYDFYYQFLVKNQTGDLVFTSDKRKIALESSPYTITITIGSSYPNPITYLQNLTNLSYTLRYNQTSKFVILEYADTNPYFSQGQLLVTIFNASGSNTIICNLTSANPNAVLRCNMSGNRTGSYMAEFYDYRSGISDFVERVIFSISTFTSEAGMFGMFGGFILLLICAFAFAYNEVAGIVAMNVGVIFVNFIGLISFGAVGIGAIVAISIIILIVVERG